MILRRRLIWMLLLALLAAQTLGLMHRVVHPASVVHEAPANSHGSWLADLLSAHDDAGCKLFDQMGQGGCRPAAVSLPLALVVPSLFVSWFQAGIAAR
ncbi:MAG: hypothetical protein ABIR26_11465, partial [Ramlibacter sp.]